MLLYNNNFHLYVIFVTVIYYFLIKKYRSNPKSRWMFILNIIYIPAILYVIAYLLTNTNFIQTINSENIRNIRSNITTKIPYDIGDISDISIYPSSVDII